MMRHILIDHARGRVAEKRGGKQHSVSLSAIDGWNPVEYNEDILALDVLLAKLETADPRAARVVELRFFGGLTEDEVAEVLSVSVITVKRDWKVARAWLMSRLQSSFNEWRNRPVPQSQLDGSAGFLSRTQAVNEQDPSVHPCRQFNWIASRAYRWMVRF